MTEQEVKPCEFVNGACIHCEATEREECEGWICPPKRPWVGLTDEDIWQMVNDCTIGGDLHADKFARAIEAKLKERNT
jgi:hypothetical protein